MGWISLGKLNLGAVRRRARAPCGPVAQGQGQGRATCGPGGVELFGSWQPTHEAFSPGWRVDQLRIVWTACPRPSIAWKYTGVRAGTVKKAEPSSWTRASPSTTFTSQLPLPTAIGVHTMLRHRARRCRCCRCRRGGTRASRPAAASRSPAARRPGRAPHRRPARNTCRSTCEGRPCWAGPEARPARPAAPAAGTAASVRCQQLAPAIEVHPVNAEVRVALATAAAALAVPAERGVGDEPFRLGQRVGILEQLALLAVAIDPLGPRLAHRRDGLRPAAS